MPQAEILKATEVAAILNIDRGTLHRLIKQGEFLDPIVILRAKRWRRQDVMDWIASRPTVKP